MTNSFPQLSLPISSQRLTSKIIRVLSTIGWLAGLTFLFASCSSQSASNSPTPVPTMKSVSTEEVKNYAKAVLAIEPKRQEAYREIQIKLNDEKVPEIVCTRADTIASLSKSVQDIAVNYCNQSKKIGGSHGLTIQKFNAITVTAKSDPELQRRIDNELIRLNKK